MTTARNADIAVKGGVLVDGKEIRRCDLFIKDSLVDGIKESESTRPANANLVIFDPTIAQTIRAKNQHTNCDYTMYDVG